MFKKVALVPRLDNDDALDLAIKIHRFLSRRGVAVVPEAEFARACNLDNGKPFSEMSVDAVITVGGDGTVLKTCMLIPKPETPILAVNMGRRGYLTEVDPGDAIEAVAKCLKGKYRLEEHWKLSLYFEGKLLTDGLNEVLVASPIPSKMLEFSIYTGKHRLVDCRADGLIVATPTGSTAHALSAGGPVLETSLTAFALVFICPLEPFRSFVLSAEEGLSINLVDPKLKASVVVDGRYQRELMPKSNIAINKSKHKAVFIRLGAPYLGRSLTRVPSLERRIE